MRVPYYKLGKYYNSSCIKFIGYVIAVLCNLNVGHVSTYRWREKNVWFHLESIDWESSCELMIIFLPFRETHLKVEILRLNEGHCKGQLFILHIPKFMRFRFHIKKNWSFSVAFCLNNSFVSMCMESLTFSMQNYNKWNFSQNEITTNSAFTYMLLRFCKHTIDINVSLFIFVIHFNQRFSTFLRVYTFCVCYIAW